MACKLAINSLFPKVLIAPRYLHNFQALRFRSNKAIRAAKEREEQGLEPIDELAYNEIVQKNGLIKPVHTVEEQIGYMNSNVYKETYQDLPIYHWYRRNLIGQVKVQPPPRLFCIDKHGRFNLNYACPVCRDEYLFFDYRNPRLIEQFLAFGTDQPISIVKSNLCREQYLNLKAQLVKAKEHGTITFSVEFRRFNYNDWYKDLPTDSLMNTSAKGEDPDYLSRNRLEIERLRTSPSVMFETHNRDEDTGWDEWWIRHAKFAKTAK